MNRRSQCVLEAFDWAFSELSLSGAVERVSQKWLKQAPCSLADWAAEESTTGRQLNFRNTSGIGKSRRRLSTAAEESGNEEASKADTFVGIKIMGTNDFAGLFFLWAFTTFAVLVVACFNSYTNDHVEKVAIKAGKRLVRKMTSGTMVWPPQVRPAPPAPPAAGEDTTDQKKSAEGGTAPGTMQASQREAQQLVLTLRDAIDCVHKMQSDMIAQSNA